MLSLLLEKSAIDVNYGFKIKKNKKYKGYPGLWFKELNDFIIVVGAKATNHKDAVDEIQ